MNVRLFWGSASASWPGKELITHFPDLVRDLRRKPDKVEITWGDSGEPYAKYEHASAALTPFVMRWNLSLNPEDVDEMAFAVLEHGRPDIPLEEIDRRVNEQIDQSMEAHRRMLDAMSKSIEERQRQGKL